MGGECTAWNPSPPVHLPATESRTHSWKTENKAETFCGPIRERLLLFSSRWIPTSKTLEHLLQRVCLREAGGVGGGQCLQKSHLLEPLQTQPACLAQPVGQQHYFQRFPCCQSVPGQWAADGRNGVETGFTAGIVGGCPPVSGKISIVWMIQAKEYHRSS